MGPTAVVPVVPSSARAPEPTASDAFVDQYPPTRRAYRVGNLTAPTSETHFTNPVPKSRPTFTEAVGGPDLRRQQC